MTRVAWDLVGGPCEGHYLAESSWPPPPAILAVHGGGLLGDGPPAVLDLPDDGPEPGETVVEYRIFSHGFACGRGRGARAEPPMFATYVPADWPDEWVNTRLREHLQQAVNRLKDPNEGVEPLTPHASWGMPQGRGDLSGCGAHDQTVGQRAGEASPATERGSNGGTDTSSASGRAAVPRSSECEVCGVDDLNCMCDDPNFVDDRWLRDEENRERLAEEDTYLYGI